MHAASVPWRSAPYSPPRYGSWPSASAAPSCPARAARVARTARLISATMLCSGVMALSGFAIGVAAVAWAGLIAGSLAWLSIPLWVLALGRALVPSQAVSPIPETAASAHRREA